MSIFNSHVSILYWYPAHLPYSTQETLKGGVKLTDTKIDEGKLNIKPETITKIRRKYSDMTAYQG